VLSKKEYNPAFQKVPWESPSADIIKKSRITLSNIFI
jgi:hypothetical protein